MIPFEFSLHLIENGFGEVEISVARADHVRYQSMISEQHNGAQRRTQTRQLHETFFQLFQAPRFVT